MDNQEIELIVNRVLEQLNASVNLPIELVGDTSVPVYTHPTDAVSI